MSNYSVSQVLVEPFDSKPNITGIDMSQNFAPGSLVPGLFYADLYTADGQTFLIGDEENGLSPESGSTTYQFVASVLPEADVMVKSYYKESPDGPVLSPQEHIAHYPTSGWAQHQIHLYWIEA